MPFESDRAVTLTAPPESNRSRKHPTPVPPCRNEGEHVSRNECPDRSHPSIRLSPQPNCFRCLRHNRIRRAVPVSARSGSVFPRFRYHYLATRTPRQIPQASSSRAQAHSVAHAGYRCVCCRHLVSSVTEQPRRDFARQITAAEFGPRAWRLGQSRPAKSKRPPRWKQDGRRIQNGKSGKAFRDTEKYQRSSR